MTEEAPVDINAALAAPEAAPVVEVEAVEDEDLSDLLAEDLDLTPEQLQAAVKRIQSTAKKAIELTQKGHKVWGAAEKRAKKVERREADARHKETVLEAQSRQFNAAFAGVQSGDAKTTLEGLRQLTGKDPIKVLEDLNLHIANNGKKRELTPEERELKERIDRLERTRAYELEQQEEQRAANFIEQRKSGLAAAAAEATDDFPLLSDFAAENPKQVGNALAELIISSANNGQKIADTDAMRMLEEHLSELSQRALKRKNGTAGSGPENGSGIPRQQPKPAAAQQAPKGKSLSVSAATATSAKRELTEEELSEDAANFLPQGLVNWARGMNA